MPFRPLFNLVSTVVQFLLFFLCFEDLRLLDRICTVASTLQVSRWRLLACAGKGVDLGKLCGWGGALGEMRAVLCALASRDGFQLSVSWKFPFFL